MTQDIDSLLTDGFPPISSYERIEQSQEFKDLALFQNRFLKEKEQALRYYSERWVANPLHNWSRRYEYPFIHQQLKRRFQGSSGATAVLDAGAGLTFFPAFLSKNLADIRIECCDHDAQICQDARNIYDVNRINYSRQDICRMTYADDSFDCVYSISVLEHIPDRDRAISELARVLRPGGVLLITFDIGLRDSDELNREEARKLLAALERHFVPSRNYQEELSRLKKETIVTTDYARRRDPTLLPWKRRSLGRALIEGARGRGFTLQPFSSLTFFCAAWTKRPH